MPFSASLLLRLSASLAATPDMGRAAHEFTEAFTLALADGAGADAAQNVFADERSLNATTSENLDLSGVLANGIGQTVTLTGVKAILAVASAANVGNIEIGGAASNGFVGPFADVTDKVVLGPGDCFLVTRRSASGMGVTAGTGDILKVNNAGAQTNSYRIVIIGKN